MCDTVVTVGRDGVVFAKNSDRDPNEAQLVEWSPAADHGSGSRQRCTWIEIDQVARTHATMVSRPFWMWGAEMGTNSAGLTIGNEAVFTKVPVAQRGLTGMDLLRLALQRAATVAEAVDVIVDLLERHPQGGGCGHENRSFRYHSSFLLADADGATVLETAGSAWATEDVAAGTTRSISNGLTIEGFAQHFASRPHAWVARAATRRNLTQAACLPDAAAAAALLRSHGRDRSPHYSLLNGAMSGPCMHAGGLVAASQTTASWISALGDTTPRHFVTAAAAPCTATFRPVDVGTPLDLGPDPTDVFDPDSQWWRHEATHRTVMARGGVIPARHRSHRDELEAQAFTAEGPLDATAICEMWNRASALDAEIRSDIGETDPDDTRPPFVRRYWAVRNRRGGLDLSAPLPPAAPVTPAA